MRILFQGDSITDAGRDRNDPHNLGQGYPKYAAHYLTERFPDRDFEFIDLGIGGNQTKDLVARLESDFIDIQPDIVSILIGVNDTWHNSGNRNWLPNDIFEERYRTVLTAIRERTHAKIMLIEPFLVPAPDAQPKMYFYEDLFPKILIIRRLAKEFADAYLPLDGLLYAEAIGREYTDISNDGVHPNPSGAQIIGHLYADAISPLIENDCTKEEL